MYGITENNLCTCQYDLVIFLSWQPKTIKKLFVIGFVKNFKFLGSYYVYI